VIVIHKSKAEGNYSGSETGGISGEGGFDGVDQVQPLFADGRNVAADHARPSLFLG
jgi:hypothetical protein